MQSHSSSLFAGCALLSTALGQVPQFAVVPAAHAATDAVSYYWIAGASQDVRQQTLVGASHLVALTGRLLTAIELRRSAAAETFQPGQAHLRVSLSTSPNQPLRCSAAFAANVGANAVQVFDGVVTLPSSPPEPGPAVAWTPANTVRIAFQTPFLYTGGTLCIDVVGAPVSGQTAAWWMADAAFDTTSGTVATYGHGCGQYGGAQGQWANASPQEFVPGGHANFWAYGSHGSFGFAAFGLPGPAIPLSALGLPSPGCDLHLGSLEALLPVLFVPETHPALMSRGGRADLSLWIPDDAALFGASMATQWFEWDQLAMSNAIQWTVAGAMPTLDMAVIDGHPSEATGHVSVHLAHVLRLEHQ